MYHQQDGVREESNKGVESLDSRIGTRRRRFLPRQRTLLSAASLTLFIALALTACSASTSARDQALGALDRATQAAELESQMANLVADIPSDPSQQQGQKINSSVKEIDSQAETILASTDTGKVYDQKISRAVTETRGAGSQITSAVDKSGQLGKARTKAVGHLGKSNTNLKQATGFIGTDLADEQGNLTQGDADALKQTIVAVDESGKKVIEAGADVLASRCIAREPDGSQYPVEIERGDVTCTEAVRVFERYGSGDLNYEGSGSFATVGDWLCGRFALGVIAAGETRAAECDRAKDGARIITRVR